ncbi:MAG: transposase [Candidatus Melainabacteria bacterium]|nr:transposase [Candidatus Melainabacteria bacterium]
MAKVKSSDDEFKQNAIALAMRGDRSMAAVARELNIPYSRLRGWVDQHKERQSK